MTPSLYRKEYKGLSSGLRNQRQNFVRDNYLRYGDNDNIYFGVEQDEVMNHIKAYLENK